MGLNPFGLCANSENIRWKQSNAFPRETHPEMAVTITPPPVHFLMWRRLLFKRGRLCFCHVYNVSLCRSGLLLGTERDGQPSALALWKLSSRSTPIGLLSAARRARRLVFPAQSGSGFWPRCVQQEPGPLPSQFSPSPFQLNLTLCPRCPLLHAFAFSLAFTPEDILFLLLWVMGMFQHLETSQLLCVWPRPAWESVIWS